MLNATESICPLSSLMIALERLIWDGGSAADFDAWERTVEVCCHLNGLDADKTIVGLYTYVSDYDAEWPF